MEAKWKLLDLIMETELKYSEFVNLLMENDEIDKKLADPIAIVAPAMALGALMGGLMKVLGISIEEYNTRAKELGKKEIKVFDGLGPPKKKKEDYVSWPIL